MSFFKKFKKIIVKVVVIALALTVGAVLVDDEPAAPQEEYVWNTTIQSEYIDYNGEKYEQNPNIETLLIGGVDNYGTVNISATTGGQADMLMLLVVNHDAMTVDIMQINRDTMANINVLNENHISVGTAKAQIALSHAYGNGGTVSCVNTVDAVEDLLFGIDIDKYLFVNMGAIPTINDFFGGVSVTIEDDFSDIDLSLVKGETVLLNGTQAFNYLHARKDMNDPTNTNRMQRHRNYIAALIPTIRARFTNSSASALELYNSIYDYMVTSISAMELASLIAKSAEYTVNEITVPDGTFAENTELEEFYVDDTLLREKVVQLFYRKIYE